MRRIVSAITALAIAALTATACGSDEPAQLERKGIALYVSTADFKNDTQAAERAQRTFAYMSDTLGANAVAMAFPIFTDGPTGSTVTVGERTPTVSRLRAVIEVAKARGFHVSLRPAIDQNNLDSVGEWRGTIEPVDRANWMRTYNQVLEPYYLLARDTHVDLFHVGVELNSMEGEPGWADVVNTARRYLPDDKLSYTKHWDKLDDGDSWKPTANMGIAAYPPMRNLGDDASVDELTAGWLEWLDSIDHLTDLSKTPLDEVGIPGMPGMYAEPWTWGADKGVAYVGKIQSNWFQAACRAAADRGMPGMYIWKLDFHNEVSEHNPDTDPPALFVGRDGEDAIRKCFTGK